MSRRIAGAVVLALVAAAYVALRLKMNREFDGAPWAALVAGTAKLPFGHRVLVPQLVQPFTSLGVSIKAAFAVTEWVATIAAVLGVRAALRHWVPPRPATLLTCGLAIALPLAYLLRYKWPIFYPWDTPAIAFTAWGLALAQGRQYRALLLLIPFAAANRESVLLLPALLVILHLGAPERRWEAIRWGAVLGVLAIAVRVAVSLAWPDNRGRALHLHVEGMLRVDHNLQWLGSTTNVLLMLGSFSLLPVLWPLLARWMPPELRRIHLIIVASVGGLMIAANIYEPRAFGEPLVLAYVGVAVAAWRWLQDEQPPPTDAPAWLRQVQRWGAVALAIAWGAAVAALRR